MYLKLESVAVTVVIVTGVSKVYVPFLMASILAASPSSAAAGAADWLDEGEPVAAAPFPPFDEQAVSSDSSIVAARSSVNFFFDLFMQEPPCVPMIPDESILLQRFHGSKRERFKVMCEILKNLHNRRSRYSCGVIP
ncbi:hypothetical protein D3C73_1394590 [compost metagenome]